MEDFPFRPHHDTEKVPNTFLSSDQAYFDPLNAMRSSLKIENPMSPAQGNPHFRKHRLSSYDNTNFYPFKEDEYFSGMHDQVKAEAYGQEYQNFGQHGQMDPNFEFQFSGKLQDYGFDHYRINRSRGPSFNLGPGRKNSEDFFAHGLDFLTFCRSLEQNEKGFAQDQHDARIQHGFVDDFRNAPLASHMMPGNLASFIENANQYGLQSGYENTLPKDFSNNPMAYNVEGVKSMKQNAEKPNETYHEPEKKSEFETVEKKKRKANNASEIPVDHNEQASDPPLKKSKSENKKIVKSMDNLAAAASLKSSKTTVGKSQGKKSKAKKGAENKQGGFEVKAEVEDQGEKADKSTAPSSTNVSPNPKKEDFPNLFKSKSSIVGTFGHFKKPETAQELLGGLALPAEVEEYINNSKIFNQIKAPIIRKIGTLTLEERRVKIEKYLEKRKRRTWSKRVNYDCRKKVADNRLRIKGRFVTKDQAFSMLEACGIYTDVEKLTNNEIKGLLNEKFGAVAPKKKENTGEKASIQNKAEKNVKVGNNQEAANQHNNYEESEGEPDTSSFGSQDDSSSETYMRD